MEALRAVIKKIRNLKETKKEKIIQKIRNNAQRGKGGWYARMADLVSTRYTPSVPDVRWWTD